MNVKPITVFIGANSSGKTSLFLPLLLLKQTWASKDRGIALKTTGPIVDLGNFRELVFRHGVGRPVSFSFKFVKTARGSSKKPNLRGEKDEPTFISFTFCQGRVAHEIKLRKFEVRNAGGEVLLRRTLGSTGRYSLRTVFRLSAGLKKIVAATKPRHFLFPPFEQLVEHAMKARKKKVRIRLSIGEKKSHRKDDDYIVMMFIVEQRITSIIQSLSYLGPLRDYPQRFYEGSEEVPDSVGSRGEKTPEVLLLRKDARFRGQLKGWLRKFGLASKIQCEPLGRGVFAVRVTGKQHGSDFDYADTGFGLSQLLPLLVQGLHADKGSVLCVEQPEIHLNPKLQSILANFFATVAKDGRFLVVETHSEHFLLRLRSLIAQKVLSPDDVGLYFVEKFGDKSKPREIPIGSGGHIESDEWPRGFFEDSVGESLRLASLQMS